MGGAEVGPRPDGHRPRRLRARTRPVWAAVTGSVLVASLASVALLPGPAGALRPLRASVTADAGSAPDGSVPAGATGSCAGFAARQALLEQDLSGRTTDLGTLTAKVTASTTLTTGDRSTLASDLADESSGIAALTAKAPGDTSCAEVGADSRTMVLSYRVYAVMTPQTDLVIVADRATSLARTLVADEPALQAAITAAAAAGRSVTVAEAAYADYTTRVQAATAALAGLSATLLAQDPAGYPANYSVFKSADTAEASARADLKVADTDLHEIVDPPG